MKWFNTKKKTYTLATVMSVALSLLLITAPVAALGGYTWTAISNFSSSSCYGLGSSSTGQYMACAVYGSDIYVSSDYGQTWTPETSAGAHDWYSLAMSSTGQYIVSADYNNGYIYVSSDYGQTWTPETSAGAGYWYLTQTSGNGQYMMAEDSLGSVALSSDYGQTWTNETIPGTSENYGGAISSTGQYIAVYDVANHTVNVSSNYGSTWTPYALPNDTNGVSYMTMTPNGQYIYASGNNSSNVGAVYISNNYGQTWTTQTIAGTSAIQQAAASSSGQYIIGGDGGGSIYESSDYGQTWVEDTNAPATGWYALAASSDLSRVIAGGVGAGAYLGYDPALYVAPTSQTTANPNPSVTMRTQTTSSGADLIAPNTGYGVAQKSFLIIGALSFAGVTSLAGSFYTFRRNRKGYSKTA